MCLGTCLVLCMLHELNGHVHALHSYAFVHKTTVGHPTLESDSLFGLEFSGKHIWGTWYASSCSHKTSKSLAVPSLQRSQTRCWKVDTGAVWTNGCDSLYHVMSSHDDSLHRTTARDGWKLSHQTVLECWKPSSDRTEQSNLSAYSILFRCSPTVEVILI